MDVIQTLKDLMELAKKVKDVAIQEKLLDLREEIQNLREKNLALESENSTLKERQRIEEQLSFDGIVYWRTKDGGRDGPFCQTCWDSMGKLIRLQTKQQPACTLEVRSMSSILFQE